MCRVLGIPAKLVGMPEHEMMIIIVSVETGSGRCGCRVVPVIVLLSLSLPDTVFPGGKVTDMDL